MAYSNICSEKVHARARQKVRDFVKSLSYLNFPIGEPSLPTMNELIEECSPIPELVEEELLKLIFHQDELDENLTIKYYAKKFLVHLRTCRLEKKWQCFLTLPASKKSLLEGAFLVSQWGQVEHEHKKSLSEIEDIIDNISKQVRQLVDAKNSTGEAYSVMDDQLTELKTVRITLDCIKTVLYDEMGFTEMDRDDICNCDYVYVDKVLLTKKGHSLILLVIYHEVAKRLGILCLPVSLVYEDCTFLRHRTTSENGTVDIYISPSTGNASEGVQLPISESFPFYVVPAKGVFMELVNYLVPCGVPHNSPCVSILNKENRLHFVRLACVITSGKVSTIESYAGWCSHFGYQLEQAMELIKSHECHDHTHWIECNQKFREQQALIANRKIHGRLPWTKYAAGLVMIYNGPEDFIEEKVYVNSGATDTGKYHHKANPPGGLCVIVSVQYNCECCRGANYRVLFDNGNLDSVSEEHLKLHPEGAVINNPHIGIFFERFDGRRYIPNPELMSQFPEDDAFAKSLIG